MGDHALLLNIIKLMTYFFKSCISLNQFDHCEMMCRDNKTYVIKLQNCFVDLTV